MNRFHSLRSWAVGFVLLIMLASTMLTSCFILALNLFHFPGLSLVLMPFGALFSSTILGTVLSYVASIRFLSPLKTLSNGIHTVAKGDYSIRMREDTTAGEMLDVMHSFNEMAQELSGTEMLRSDFINTFSHEFKTPIVSIRGFARQLQKGNLTPEQQNEYIDIIAMESDRLANMASTVLLLTKLEHQQIVTDRSAFSLDEQLRSCVLLLERQWEEKNITWDMDLPEVTYVGNQEMMSHIWINLFNNAIKFSAADTEITVKMMVRKSEIAVTITDHGPGMTKETLAHIFEKFYQGDTSHAAKGNGLGLSLVKRIVELCDGRITVESEEGKGSTFAIYLPVKEE